MEYIFRKQIERLKKTGMIYVPFGQGTRLPFITCDDDTFNDQVWIFVREDAAQLFARARMEQNQDVLSIAKLENKQVLPFYGSLYLLGVNELVFVEEGRTTKLPLDHLVKLQEPSGLPENKRPLVNPQMQLTGIYFMQEIQRKKPNKEKPKLRELEEEMAANLVRTRFMMAVELRDPQKGLEASNMNIPCVKNQADKMFQPFFTDGNEFAKFNKDKKFQPVLVDFVNIEKVLSSKADGIAVNPLSTNIVILKDKIPVILKRFAGRAEGGSHGRAADEA